MHVLVCSQRRTTGTGRGETSLGPGLGLGLGSGAGKWSDSPSSAAVSIGGAYGDEGKYSYDGGGSCAGGDEGKYSYAGGGSGAATAALSEGNVWDDRRQGDADRLAEAAKGSEEEGEETGEGEELVEKFWRDGVEGADDHVPAEGCDVSSGRLSRSSSHATVVRHSGVDTHQDLYGEGDDTQGKTGGAGASGGGGGDSSSRFSRMKAAMRAKVPTFPSKLRDMKAPASLKLTRAVRYHLSLVSRAKPPTSTSSGGGGGGGRGVPLKHKGGGGVSSMSHVPHLGITNGPAVLTVFRCGLVRVYRAPG